MEITVLCLHTNHITLPGFFLISERPDEASSKCVHSRPQSTIKIYFSLHHNSVIDFFLLFKGNLKGGGMTCVGKVMVILVGNCYCSYPSSIARNGSTFLGATIILERAVTNLYEAHPFTECIGLRTLMKSFEVWKAFFPNGCHFFSFKHQCYIL